MPSDRQEQLLGSIYDCAIDRDQWPATLAALRDTLRFRFATLSLQTLPGATPVVSATSGIDARWLQDIPRHGADYIARWGGHAVVEALPFAEPAVLSRVNARAHWEQTRWYREWAKPQRIHDLMAIGVMRGPALVGSIILGRHEDDGAISAADCRAARAWVPHLQRAVAINRIAETNGALGSVTEAALDGLGCTVLLIDDRLRIVNANRAATSLLSAGDLAYGRDQSLRLGPSAARLLLAILARSSREEFATGRSVTSTLVSLSGRPCSARIIALGGRALLRATVPDAAAAIMIAPAPHPPRADTLAKLFDLPLDEAVTLAEWIGAGTGNSPQVRSNNGLSHGETPGDAVLARCQRLAAEHGLTPAETAVTLETAKGDGRAAVAMRLGIRETTVRSHLSAIFDKVGVRRQAELVRLLYVYTNSH